MEYVLLGASVLSELFATGIFRNAYCKEHVKNSADLYLFNAVSSIVTLAGLALISAIGGSLCMPSLYTALFGVIFGLVTAGCAIFHMMALETGPLSYTKVIVSCSMVIPALSGFVLYQESVSVWQYIGMALVLLALVLAVDHRQKDRHASIRWFLYCLAAMILSGSIGVMQKIHQSSPHKGELGAFLLIAFSVSALFSFLMIPYFLKKEHCRLSLCESSASAVPLVLYSLVCGAGIAFCNHFNMYLSGVIESVILFPVLNGGSMLLTTAAGLILWKEKLTRAQTAGMILGAAAILLLCDIVPLLVRLIS